MVEDGLRKNSAMLSALCRLMASWIHAGFFPKFGHVDESAMIQFLQKLETGFECSIDVFLVAVIYLVRLHDSCEREINMHHALLSSSSIAYKFLHDESPDYKLHAYVGGVSPSDLACLERSFLSVVQFRLFVSEHEYATLSTSVRDECLSHDALLYQAQTALYLPSPSQSLKNDRQQDIPHDWNYSGQAPVQAAYSMDADMPSCHASLSSLLATPSCGNPLPPPQPSSSSSVAGHMPLDTMGSTMVDPTLQGMGWNNTSDDGGGWADFINPACLDGPVVGGECWANQPTWTYAVYPH